MEPAAAARAAAAGPDVAASPEAGAPAPAARARREYDECWAWAHDPAMDALDEALREDRARIEARFEAMHGRRPTDEEFGALFVRTMIWQAAPYFVRRGDGAPLFTPLPPAPPTRFDIALHLGGDAAADEALAAARRRLAAALAEHLAAPDLTERRD